MKSPSRGETQPTEQRDKGAGDFVGVIQLVKVTGGWQCTHGPAALGGIVALDGISVTEGQVGPETLVPASRDRSPPFEVGERSRCCLRSTSARLGASVTRTRAVGLWSVAVAAGVFESLIAIASVLDAGEAGAGLAVQVLVRAFVYAGAALLVHRLARGRRLARPMLTILLGVVGLAAMVVPGLMAMANGDALVSAFGDGKGAAFVFVRLLHIGTVVLATVMMYAPASSRWLGQQRQEADIALAK